MTRRILLITVDRLPAWILPAWGATWVSAPAIDGLALAGVVLDRCLATALDPLATLDDLVSGLLRGAASAGLGVRLVTDDVAVAGRFRGAAVDAVVVDPGSPRRRARSAEESALGRLFAAGGDAVRGAAAVTWVHASSLGSVWDAPESFHEPYVDPEDPPPPGGAAAPRVAVDRATDPDLPFGHRQIFAGQVSMLDRLVGGLLSTLPADGPAWSVCLAGVRGMPLGLHGWIGAPKPDGVERPYGESIHLPVVIADAAGRMAGQRTGALVVPADVGVSLEALLGLPPRRPGEAGGGRSLEPLLDDWTAPARDRVITVAPGGTAVNTVRWSWVGGGAAAAPVSEEGRSRGELFAKPDDFFEACDVADRCPAVAAELAALAGLADGGRLDEALGAALDAAASVSAPARG